MVGFSFSELPPGLGRHDRPRRFHDPKILLLFNFRGYFLSCTMRSGWMQAASWSHGRTSVSLLWKMSAREVPGRRRRDITSCPSRGRRSVVTCDIKIVPVAPELGGEEGRRDFTSLGAIFPEPGL